MTHRPQEGGRPKDRERGQQREREGERPTARGRERETKGGRKKRDQLREGVGGIHFRLNAALIKASTCFPANAVPKR